MSSTIFRDRERERDRWDDSRTTLSTNRGGGEGFTTVKRYRIPAEDTRSNASFSDRRFSDRGGERTTETRIVRREVEREPERVERDVRIIREREEPRVERDVRIIREREEPIVERDVRIIREREEPIVERDVRIIREREEPRPERELVVRRREVEEAPVIERDVVIRRESTRERPDFDRGYERDYRFEREVDTLSPTRGRDPYDLAKYSRSTEYFSRPDPPPQPIIIRQEPQQIIIQERRDPIYIERDSDDYQLVKTRTETDERSVARREPRDEEIFYEKRVKEIDRGRDDDYEERREFRREVSPGDSVSQVGRRRDRDRDYASDDSYEYIRRKETDTYERDESPHHKRHLLEGVVAGVGAAEVLRRHHKKEGQETSGAVGRIGKDVGAGVLGAVAATAVSRYRSKSRNRSRSRRRESSSESDESRGGRRRHRSKHRSKSRSPSRAKQLGALGLGAAAIGALALAARNKNNNNNNAEDRRSRSRTRRHSIADDPSMAANPGHQNNVMAKAGLAGAVVAGLVEHQRNKSRDRKGERSQSRLRKALPVIAAGLGSAGVAKIYENQKAKKEIAAENTRRRSRSRGSRSRSRSVVYDGPRGAAASDSGLIEYGNEPVYGAPATDYYGRPIGTQPTQPGYYSNEMVPAAVAGAAYGAGREEGRSRDRHRSSSSSISDRGERRRQRHKKSRSRSGSRGHDLATAGLAAGAGALAANEYNNRKERKKAEKARRRYEAEHDPYEEGYDPAPYTPPPQGQYAHPQEQFYPSTNSFPPPPAVGGAPYPPQQQGGPYNPQDYPPPPGAIPQQPAAYQQGPYSPPPGGPYASGARRADDIVSVSPRTVTPVNAHPAQDGLRYPATPAPPSFAPPPANYNGASTPRSSSQPPPSTKSVAFAGLSDSELSFPDRARHNRRSNDRDHHRHDYEADDSDSTIDNRHHSSRPSSNNHHRHRHSAPLNNLAPTISREPNASPAPSDETIDLPERFDKHGRRKPEAGDDPLADKIQELLGGAGGSAGKIIKGLFGGGGGGSGGESSGGGRKSGRDRR